jgi:hypothetical protein
LATADYHLADHATAALATQFCHLARQQDGTTRLPVI